jgi:tetratricopeptide (TPR) repeat protein
VQIDPNYARAHLVLGYVYWQEPTLGDARAEFQKAVELEEVSPLSVGWLGAAYAKAGKHSEASKILRDLQELSKHRYVPPFFRAFILAEMDGKKETLLDAMEKGYEDRLEFMYTLKVASLWDSYRSEPRFQALLRRMNFPERRRARP